MAITPWNNSSLRGLSNRVSRLESAFGQLAKAVRYDAPVDATRLYPISAFISQLRWTPKSGQVAKRESRS